MAGLKPGPPQTWRIHDSLWALQKDARLKAGASKAATKVRTHQMENREVARVLRETAQLLEIDGASIGRFRTYERTAELLDSMPESVEELAREREKLLELPGVGDGMADHIDEILKTGDYSVRQKLLKKYPATLL